MIVGLIIVALLLIVTAFNNSFDGLTTALEQDIPQYAIWGLAIAAIVAIGYIPGMQKPSRWLLLLVVVVLVLTQYQNVINGFSQFASSTTPSGSGAAEPTSQYVQSQGANPTPTQQEIAGMPSGTSSTASAVASGTAPIMSAAQMLAANPLNASAYVSAFSGGFGSSPVSSSAGNFQGPQTPDSLTAGFT